MSHETKVAFLLIDMQYGFLHPDSIHCIRNAAATVPSCAEAIRIARKKEIPVFFIKRHYRADGSDVENTRYSQWVQGGRGLSPDSWSAQEPDALRPQPGDYTIIKPRWSAFFQTELDLILRRLGIRTVILAGTTTPNCIRTTCYDANALDYNVIVLSDCTSSQTEEIQRVNLEDMARMGAVIWTLENLRACCPENMPDLTVSIRSDILSRATKDVL